MKLTLSCVCCFALLFGSLNAQENEIEVVADEASAIVVQSGSDASGFSTGTTIMTMDASELAEAPIFVGNSFGNSGFSFDMSGSNFSLLNNPSVQKDLQLVDEQLDQIKAINEEFSEKVKEKMDEMKGEDGGFRFNSGSGFGELIADLRAQQKEQIEGLLLPNQQDRLKQVARQMKMKRVGSEKALTTVLAEELEITSEQKKRLRKKSKQLQDDLEKKIADLKANAKKELLQELNQDQRNKLESLLGDEFVVKEEDNENRFPGIRRMLRDQRSKQRDF